MSPYHAAKRRRRLWPAYIAIALVLGALNLGPAVVVVLALGGIAAEELRELGLLVLAIVLPIFAGGCTEEAPHHAPRYRILQPFGNLYHDWRTDEIVWRSASITFWDESGKKITLFGSFEVEEAGR